MQIGVERQAGGTDFFDAVVGKSRLELGEHPIDAVREGLGVRSRLLRGAHGQAKIVNDGQQILQHSGGGKEAKLVFLPHGATTEIFEVGDRTHVAIEIGGGLLLGGGDLGGGFYGERGCGSGHGRILRRVGDGGLSWSEWFGDFRLGHNAKGSGLNYGFLLSSSFSRRPLKKSVAVCPASLSKSPPRAEASSAAFPRA